MAEIAKQAIAASVLAFILWWLLQRISESIAYAKFKTRPAHWLTGNILDMEGQNVFSHIKTCMKLDAKVYGNWMGSSMMISLVHPDTTKVVMARGTHRAWNYRLFKPWFGEMSMFVDGDAIWHAARRAMTPMFKQEMLKGYMSAYTVCASTLMTKWDRDEWTTVDCHEDFSLLTLDLTLQAGFGCKTQCQVVDHKLPQYFGAMNELIWKRTINPLLWSDIVYNRYSDGKVTKEYKDFINDFCSNLITVRQQQLEAGVEVAVSADGLPTDFLQHLLKAGDRLSHDEILASIIGLIFASFDTGCVSLSWIFYAFAKYPEWQEICRKEVLEIFGDESLPEYNQLPELTNLTMFIKECLRVWPPAPILGRSNPHEIEVDGKKVPKDSWIEIGVWATHHNPAVWPDPEKFDPHRFAPGVNIKPYSFLPFSAGPRSCLGQQFAMNELRTVVGMLIRDFEVRPDPTLPEPQLKAEIMLLTEKGLRVEIRKLPSSTFSAPDGVAEVDRAAENPAPATDAKPQQVDAAEHNADDDADVLQSPPVRRRAKKTQ